MSDVSTTFLTSGDTLQPQRYDYAVLAEVMDREIAQALVESLIAAGARVFDEIAWRAVTTPETPIHDALSSSKVIVVLVPNRDTGSKSRERELRTALEAADENAQSVVALLLEDAQLPYELAKFAVMRLGGKGSIRSVAAGLESLRHESDEEASTATAISNSLPDPGTVIGRRQLLAALYREPHSSAATTWIVGKGGVGKTYLAAAYARRELTHRDVVWWIPANRESTVIRELAAMSHALSLPSVESSLGAADLARSSVEWLSTTEQRWLLVLDDVKDLDVVEAWVPRPRKRTGKTVITSRLLPSKDVESLVTVGSFSRPASLKFLLSRVASANPTASADVVGAQRVAEQLGDYPLALQQAAAWLSSTQGTWQDLLVELARQTEESASPESRLHRVVLMAVRRLDGESPLAGQLLRVMSLMAQAPIPATLLASGSPWSDLHLEVSLDEVERAIETLSRNSLVARHRSGAIQVHPLVMDAVREMAGGRDLALAVQGLDRLLPQRTDDPDSWALASQLLPHVLSVGEHNALVHGDGADAFIRLMDWGARFLQARGESERAIPVFSVALRVAERVRGPGDQTTVTARANLANSLAMEGRLEEAVSMQEQVLEDSERLLGDDHPSTLAALTNLAASFWDQGRMEEALLLETRALVESERILGLEHPSTLTARANLAVSYQRIGRIDEALALQQQVLADSERILGLEHPSTLTARANLAVSYQRIGRIDEALALQQQVLADSERILGLDHPSTLTARANLAASYQRIGRIDEALALQQQVLADSERILGLDHPSTLTARANLAASYQRIGRIDEALALQQQVLADSERILGLDHPSTLTARANLAASYQRIGRIDEALALQQQVLADSERILGLDHPSTLTARANLAASYQRIGRIDEALALQQQVLADSEGIGDVRSRAVTMGQIADIHYRRGDLDEALRIRAEEELPVYERLGDIRSRAVTMGQIADIHYRRGELDEALRIRTEEELPVYERLGDIRSRAVTMGKIADIHYRRGELDEALRIRTEEELPVYERLGDIRSRAVTMGQIADIHYRRGELDEALRIRTEEELPVYERLGDIRSRAVTMGKIADIHYRRGELDEALRIRTEEELPAYERLGDRDGVAAASWGLAQIHIEQENYEAAYPPLISAYQELVQLGRPDGLAVVGEALGQLLLAAEHDDAQSVLRTAMHAHNALGQTEQAKRIAALLQAHNRRRST